MMKRDTNREKNTTTQRNKQIEIYRKRNKDTRKAKETKKTRSGEKQRERPANVILQQRFVHSPTFFVILTICGHGGTLFTARIPPFLSLSQVTSFSIPSFMRTVNLLSCGRSRAVFFSPSYSLGLLEKVCCEKSWLLDGTQAAFLSPDLSVYLALSFILASFFGLSLTPPSSSII